MNCTSFTVIMFVFFMVLFFLSFLVFLFLLLLCVCLFMANKRVHYKVNKSSAYIVYIVNTFWRFANRIIIIISINSDYDNLYSPYNGRIMSNSVFT